MSPPHRLLAGYRYDPFLDCDGSRYVPAGSGRNARAHAGRPEGLIIAEEILECVQCAPSRSNQTAEESTD